MMLHVRTWGQVVLDRGESETPITLYIKPLWIKILILLLNCVTV